MAPLQKRTLYSFLIGTALAVALVIVIVIKGIASFDDAPGFRTLSYALWVGVPLVYLVVINLTLKPNQTDERDRLIVQRAARIQNNVVIISLVGWVIGLTEAFYADGSVPVGYLTLIMIFTLIVSTLAQSAGILIGYWRGTDGK
jgi:hypothetical protein